MFLRSLCSGQVKHPKHCLYWWHITAVAHVGFFLPSFPRRKFTFPLVLPAKRLLLLLLLLKTQNSKRSLKTTTRQLCQHGQPSSGRRFYDNRLGEPANTLPTLTMQHIRSSIRHLSYLHATASSHTPPATATMRAGCPALGTQHTH